MAGEVVGAVGERDLLSALFSRPRRTWPTRSSST